MLTWPQKDPNEVLDYQLDWSDRLEEAETIEASLWDITDGSVVSEDETNLAGVTTIWLSGGVAGEACVILNRITTSNGRIYDQSVRLRIRSN